MTYVVLDDKGSCAGFYYNGELHLGESPTSDMGPTWKYLPNLPSDTKFLQIYCNGKDYADVCPEHLKDEYTRANNVIKAHVRSCIEAHVSLSENCIYDLIPKKDLMRLCEIKVKIMDYVEENYVWSEPKDYKFRVQLSELLFSIEKQNINIKNGSLNHLSSDPRAAIFLKQYAGKNNHIKYNQYSSKTGRLTMEDGSFPILNLNKSYRASFVPNNDCYVDIDFNAAEIRTFLALDQTEQPDIDIHEWNQKQFGYATREEAKTEFISWLYGKKNDKEEQFREYYNSKLIKSLYYDGVAVRTRYDFEIFCDDFHALNYIVQSTTASVVLRQAIKVNEFLAGKKTKIAMIIHDNIILDLDINEKDLLKEILDIYTNTDLGRFKASVSIGRDLGNMRKIK